MDEQRLQNEKRELAEAVQAACVQAAVAGYEQAAMDGLCHEGAMEVAVDAIRRLVPGFKKPQ
jgi:F0F1-type ATP synthase membrane subunit b/b'